jgi:hypothetical protein
MAQAFDSIASTRIAQRHSILRRLGIGLCRLVLLVIGLLVITGGGVAWWIRARNIAAHRWIAEEVARIHAVGEPITEADCYAYEAALAATPDVTPLWIAGIEAWDRSQAFEDGESLSIVGLADDETLLVDSPGSTLLAARDYLQEHDEVLKAAHVAARQSGQCVLTVRFEDGPLANVSQVTTLVHLSRMLKLQLRVRALEGDIEGAIASLEAIAAASRALNQQLVAVKYLVSLRIAEMAEQEALTLLNQHQLIDDQLAQMQAILTRLDPKGGLTPALCGERAYGYHLFHHLGSLDDEKHSPLAKYDGQLIRPVDCQTYLQWTRELIDYSKQDFPAALDHAQKFDARVNALTDRPIERLWHVTSLLLIPASPTIFKTCGLEIARKEATVAAIAAERFSLKYGAYPNSLRDLVPEFLPVAPIDPFTGDGLRLAVGDGELLIYSFGPNRKDDGGKRDAANEELDIVARIRVGQ